jgi:PPOX class probable F420-dependent enzyme
MDSGMPDPSTPFGARVARRLREEHVIWLTTVDASGAPQPTPVWFLWDGDTVLIYNRNDARRIAHVQRNPRVALHFDGDKWGGDIVVITGTAQPFPHDVTPIIRRGTGPARRRFRGSLPPEFRLRAPCRL